jgi:hypothetical protein
MLKPYGTSGSELASIQPLAGVHMSTALWIAPRSSSNDASPSRSIVGVALGWM